MYLTQGETPKPTVDVPLDEHQVSIIVSALDTEHKAITDLLEGPALDGLPAFQEYWRERIQMIVDLKNYLFKKGVTLNGHYRQ